MARKPAKKKKSAKKVKATVHVAMQRMEKIKKVAQKAGLGKDLKKALGKTKKTVFIQMDRNKFHELKSHAQFGPHLDDCDCDENDIACVCT